MDISHRIHARKVVLSYFYQRCFFLYLAKNTTIIQDSLAFDHVFPDHKDFDIQSEKFTQELSAYNNEDTDDAIQYMLDHLFDKRKDAVEGDYIAKILPLFDTYYQEVKDIVDTHTTTFSFDKMDLIDQALFILGYAEHKKLATPKEILINELVELAKRYADEWSAKLLNGIMHKVLTPIT